MIKRKVSMNMKHVAVAVAAIAAGLSVEVWSRLTPLEKLAVWKRLSIAERAAERERRAKELELDRADREWTARMEKQEREEREAYQRKRAERDLRLSKMTEEERKDFLEKERVRERPMAIQSVVMMVYSRLISDGPYRGQGTIEAYEWALKEVRLEYLDGEDARAAFLGDKVIQGRLAEELKRWTEFLRTNNPDGSRKQKEQ